MRCQHGWFLLEVLREESVCLILFSFCGCLYLLVYSCSFTFKVHHSSLCISQYSTFSSSAIHSLCPLLTRILIITFSPPGSLPHLKILNFNHICKVPFAILLGNIHRFLRLEPQYFQRPLFSLSQIA